MFVFARRFIFESRTNVFLSGKAKTAVETRQDSAVFFETQRKTADYADFTIRKTDGPELLPEIALETRPRVFHRRLAMLNVFAVDGVIRTEAGTAPLAVPAIRFSAM